MVSILRAKYPVTYNKVLAKELGVGWRTLIRKARELGIEKEEGFLDKRRDEITKMATEAHPPHPHKGVKGWCVPGSEAYRFKPGHISYMARDPEVVKKVHQARNKTIARERMRLMAGLSPITNLKLKV